MVSSSSSSSEVIDARISAYIHSTWSPSLPPTSDRDHAFAMRLQIHGSLYENDGSTLPNWEEEEEERDGERGREGGRPSDFFSWLDQ